MPVLRLIIQDLKPYLDKYLIKTHISIVPLVSIYFFNPRSSKWEPILQPLKISVDYLVLLTPDGENVKILVECKNEEVVEPEVKEQKMGQKQKQLREVTDNETGILRLNISSQMLSTLLAAKEVALSYKKQLQSPAFAILNFIMNKSKQQPVKQKQ